MSEAIVTVLQGGMALALSPLPTPEYVISNHPNVTNIGFAVALEILLGTERE